MARARNIKPSFFMNEVLAECDPLCRLLFAGLWTIADREGRLEDRAKKIKAEVLPYDNCDCDALLQQLAKRSFILRYEANGSRFIQIQNFAKHQNPHVKEAASTIPAPCSPGAPLPPSDSGVKPLISEESGEAPDKHHAGMVQNVPLPSSPIPLTDPLSCAAGDGFRKVFDFGIELFPQLAPTNNSPIHMWLNAGCKVDLDILPELRRNRGKTPRSWNYFTGGVMDAKATRERPPPAGNPRRTKPVEIRSNVTTL